MCISWPDRIVGLAPPAPPAPLSRKPKSPCHHCHAGESLKAPKYGAHVWLAPLALLGPHLAPPGCNCVDKQKAKVTSIKYCTVHTHTSCLSGLSITLLWIYITSAATNRHTYIRTHAPVDRRAHTHTAGPAQCLISWVITGLWSRFTAEAAANDFQHQHQHRELCSCDLQTQLHRSMTRNKRPWKIQYNDYGEENYSYISGWAMLRGCSSIRFRTDLVIVKAPAVNLSYLQPLGLYGTPLSGKSSVQHIQASLTKTGLNESWLDNQWPVWSSTHRSSGL